MQVLVGFGSLLVGSNNVVVMPINSRPFWTFCCFDETSKIKNL